MLRPLPSPRLAPGFPSEVILSAVAPCYATELVTYLSMPTVTPFKSPAVVNGRTAKAPPHGFGRHKEDVHAYQDYFHRIRNGTFVEVGAGDGELYAPHGGS